MPGNNARWYAELREEAAFQDEQRRAREGRICKVAREHPDMPLCLLAERFGETPKTIQLILADHGIRREPEFFAARYNGRRA